MKPKIVTFLIPLLVAGSVQAQDLISVNFFSIGKPSSSVWTDDPAPDPDVATLTIEDGESAGAWDTTEWENIDFGNPFSNNGFGPVTVTGTNGVTATLEFIDRRNSGPWDWNGVRDDSDAVSVGNATLFDGHTNGTEVDGGGANPFPTAITDFEVRDITFPLYDVIVYIGANSGQYGTGAFKIRVNDDIAEDPEDQGGAAAYTLLGGEPDGTLDEITDEDTTGNYVMFTALTSPTFRVQVWGNGFNHIGASGIQIRENTQTVGAVSAEVSTVEASSAQVPANGVLESTITVTLKDASGLPVVGKDVTLANTSGPGAATIAPAGPQTTAADGAVTFTVRSSTAGAEVFTATDVTDGNLVIIQTASVEFLEVGVVSADLSTVEALPRATMADGTSTSAITVTLIDTAGLPLEGKEVTLANTAGPMAVTIDPATAQTTDANGQVTFTVTSSTPGTEVFAATDVTDGNLVLTQTTTVAFVEPIAEGLFSVNLFAYGRGTPDEWLQESWRETVRLDPTDPDPTAGVWETTLWENVSATAGTALLTTNDGTSTATFTLNDARNAAPWNWVTFRDDSDSVDVGNATLLDGHGNGTEVDGGGGNPWPEAIYDFSVSDIPFKQYDVIVYIGANSGQYGSGFANIRVTGQLPADPLDPATNSQGTLHFQLLGGEPTGVFDEVTGPDDTGNYVLYEGLTESTFRAQVWGDGFNHIAAAGFQIKEATPDVITLSIAPNPTNPGHYDFAWNGKAAKVYDLVSSTDLSTPPATWPVWQSYEAIDGVAPETTLADVPGGGDVRFFAVVEKDPPPLFLEDFESGAIPNGWVAAVTSGTGTVWEVGDPSGGFESGPLAASSGSNCAGTNIAAAYTADVDVKLTSPGIAIPAGSGATLNFQQFIDTDLAGDLGSVRILDAGNADAPIAGLEITGIEGDGTVTTDWTEATLSMAAGQVGGKTIKIEFQFVSDDSTQYGGFYIDDVAVTKAAP